MTKWITDKHLSPIANQPPTSEIRHQLKRWTEDNHQPVCVSYSLGKDAITTALALLEDEIPFIPVFFYEVPDLEFVNETIEYQQEKLGVRIRQYPHPSLYRWLNELVYQPPEKSVYILASDLITPTYEQMWEWVKANEELKPETWVADGVRAADSIVRRASLSRHGIMKPSNCKVSPVADWRINAVREIMKRHNFDLPIDYELFGRSFDGLDPRFLRPIKENLPKDYMRILEWFPLADIGLSREVKYFA